MQSIAETLLIQAAGEICAQKNAVQRHSISAAAAEMAAKILYAGDGYRAHYTMGDGSSLTGGDSVWFAHNGESTTLEARVGPESDGVWYWVVLPLKGGRHAG